MELFPLNLLTFLLYFINSISCDTRNEGQRQENQSNRNLPKTSYLYSPLAIQALAKGEDLIYQAINNTLHNCNISQDNHLTIRIKEWISDYEESSVNRLYENETQAKKDYMIVANPLMSHRLIRRFALGFGNGILKDGGVENGSLKALHEIVAHLRDNILKTEFPTMKEDYTDSLEAILRIQQYTGLKSQDVGRGYLGPLNTSIKLSSQSAFELGVMAGMMDPLIYMEQRIGWLEVAGSQNCTHSDVQLPCSVFKEMVKQELDDAEAERVELCKGTGDLQSCIQRERTARFQKENRSLKKFYGTSNPAFATKLRTNYIRLCSGLQQKVKPNLSCWLDNKGHPSLLISPRKLELIHDSPMVLQIHEFIGSRAISDIIKRGGGSNLRRSRVVAIPGTSGHQASPGNTMISTVRTSSQTWIHSGDPILTSILGRISKRIEEVTGLSVVNDFNRTTQSSEAWQVARYGTSHHYMEHLDAILDEQKTQVDGDRIATFMIYLNDVDVGGLTAFPMLDVALQPSKGDAIFWYNLKRNGEVDRRTWHGGCPVVHGTKWVMNKWILSHNNFLNRPCSLRKTLNLNEQ